MPNTTTYEFGEVVVVPFPFSDIASAKQRPAVIVNSASYNSEAEAVVISETEHHDLVIVVAITSVEGALGAAKINHWRQAGLLHPSAFKPAITTLNSSRVIRRLGRLSDPDRNRLKQVLVKVLNLVPSPSTSPKRPS